MKRKQKVKIFSAEYIRSGIVTLPHEYMKQIGVEVGDMMKFEVHEGYIKIKNANHIVDNFRINEGNIDEDSDIK